MNRSLIFYPNHFSPVTLNELEFAKEISLRYDAEVIFLPIKEDQNASFFDRYKILEAAVNEFNYDSFLLSDSLNGVSFQRFVSMEEKANDYFVLMDQNNLDFLSSFQNSLLKGKVIVSFDSKNSSSTEIENRLLQKIDLCLSTIQYIHEKKLFYVSNVEPYLSSHRLLHSESVALLSYRIAKSNQLKDPGRFYIAGLLHDIGKRVDIDASKTMMENDFKGYLSYPSWSYHQFVGSLLAKNDFHIKDKEILDAICYHCTGKANMSAIGEVLYSADKIDPLRGWDSSSLVKTCLENYHEGFLKTLKANRIFLKEKMGNEDDNQLSKDCYHYYLKEE